MGAEREFLGLLVRAVVGFGLVGRGLKNLKFYKKFTFLSVRKVRRETSIMVKVIDYLEREDYYYHRETKQ